MTTMASALSTPPYLIDEEDETTPLLLPSPSTTSTSSRTFSGFSFFKRKRHPTKRRFDFRTQPVLLVGVSLVTVVFVFFLLFRISFGKSHHNDGLDSRGRLYPAVMANGSQGAVATENQVCSQIGVDVLKQGGSAVDAAIASTFCVGTLNMFSSGIGGGGFMIVRDPSACHLAAASTTTSIHANNNNTAQYITIDFRETGPAAANETMYKGRIEQARYGGLSVGVPGELGGLQEAYKRWGKLSWKRLIMPSVQLARETTVSKELARRLVGFGEFMYQDPVWAEIFVSPTTGKLLVEGDVIRRTAYANTLEQIANHGVEVFYKGSIAESLVETVQSKGGILTTQDLLSYRPIVQPALQGRWNDYNVFTTHAPTSGPVLLSIFHIFSGFPDFIKTGPTALNIHRFIESLKYAFAQRTELADPAFLSSKQLNRIEQISSIKEAKRLLPFITDNQTHSLEYYHPKFDIVTDHGTTHVSVIDQNNMAVSLTSTVNLIFGSRVMDSKTGIILNDQMDDTSTPGIPNAFGLTPSPFNYPNSNKRPLSSTCPTILESPTSKRLLIIGGSGGSRIFSSIAQTVFRHLNWNQTISDSIESARIHHQLLPTQLSVESLYDSMILDQLSQKGHQIDTFDINLGLAEVQAVSVFNHDDNDKDKKLIFAASDSRKNGIAVAY